MKTSSKTIRLCSLVVCSIAFLVAQSDVAKAQTMRTYKNCKDIKSQYFYGVASSASGAGAMFGIVDVVPKFYKKYRRFDFDNDGLICEDDELQRSREFLSTSTSSVATTTTVALRTPPNGDWDGDLLYSSKPLTYGGWYMFGLCTSGSAYSTLKLWANVNGEYFQKAESFPVAGHSWCADPNFSVLHRFYWAIDWMGSQVSSGTYRLDLKVTGLKTDTFLSRYIVSNSSQNQVSPGMTPAEATNLALKIACIFGKVKCS